MNKDKVLYRPLKKDDIPTLMNIVRKTWNYDKFADPKTAIKLSKVFLYSCLANQNYTKVAEIDGNVAGIIMVKNNNQPKSRISYRIKQICSIISIYATSSGRKSMMPFNSVHSIDKELLDMCNIKYQGEIAFFALDEKYRGYGIGKSLFNQAKEYLQNEHVENFYLFTDTSCNYGFYDANGLTRRCSKDHFFTINNQDANMSFFIYDYSFK